jgi:endonuclease YncB( thermonuclease family)/methylphosphotriester-DNA--protein-cysteine methyltransferase
MVLFNDDVLKKMDGKYFLIPALETEYKEYFSPAPKVKTFSQESQAVQLTSTETRRPPVFLNRKFLVIGMIILLVSVFAFYFYYAGNEESGLCPFDTKTITDSDSGNQTNPSQEPSPTPSPSPSPTPSPEPETTTIHIDRISYCVSVIDGDTIEICHEIRVRLADIDAPESYETGYEISKNALKSRVLEKRVFLDIDGTDGHGRYVCVLYVISGSRYKNVNCELVEAGYAVYDDHENAFDPNSWYMFESDIDITQAEVDSEECIPSEPEAPSWALYVGSSQSNKYHKLSCYWVDQITPSNRIYFRTASEAESNGYQPCQVCLKSSTDESEPPSWAVYVGSELSDKYHKLTCHWASQINPENMIYFSSKNDAESQGYQPCQVCLKSSSGDDETPPSSKTYVGSINSDVYHELTCHYATQIKSENRIYFTSKADAESKGYRPCKVCIK